MAIHDCHANITIISSLVKRATGKLYSYFVGDKDLIVLQETVGIADEYLITRLKGTVTRLWMNSWRIHQPLVCWTSDIYLWMDEECDQDKKDGEMGLA